MSTTGGSSYVGDRLLAWRTMLLAGGVLVAAALLDVLVLGAGRSPSTADGAVESSSTALPAESPPATTVVLGMSAPLTPRPIPVFGIEEIEGEPSMTGASAVVATGVGAPVAAVPPTGVPTGAAPVAPAPVTTPTPTVAPSGTAAPAGAPPGPSGGTPTQIATTPTTTSPTTTTTPSMTSPTTAPPTTAPSTTSPSTTSPSTTAPPVQYRTYGTTAGEVVLADAGSSITLYGVSAAANWVYQVEQNGPREVALKFFDTATGRDSEWKAQLESGRIRIES